MWIDAHHHFWKYDPVQYSWINDAMRAIRCDFLPDDLQAEIAAAGIEGVVSVQARQTLDETRWLLTLAERNKFIRGVVGWAPLVSPDVESELAPLAAHAKLKAVRHVLQDEPDDYMLRDDFNAGLAALRQFNLVYDILIYERQLATAIQLVDRHPEQVFVLDHLAKPRVRDGVISPWRENLHDLARRPNVYCKLSGLVTEGDYRGWTRRQLFPYLETALEAFGPPRLMFGSDWPVCLVACDYPGWHDLVFDFLTPLSVAERRRVLGETAVEAYRL